MYGEVYLVGCNVGDLGLSTLSVSMIALKELYLC